MPGRQPEGRAASLCQPVTVVPQGSTAAATHRAALKPADRPRTTGTLNILALR